MQVNVYTLNGLEAIRLAEHDLAVVVLPRLGAKISSLRWQGHELLAQNPLKPLVPARYAAPYAEFDASGFDECLPSVGPCLYPQHPWQQVEVPDHGEVWSIPGTWEVQPDAVHLQCRGMHFPYDFHKSLAVTAPGSLRLSYVFVNHAPLPFKFIWSSHPLFALRPGMRIYLPPDTRVRVDWSRDERLGVLLDEHPWPHTTDRSGSPVDLSLILPPDVGLVDKLYTTRLTQGWCALHDPETERYAAFLFSPEHIPYVGLSINLGGWPVDGPGYYNLGLEPCNGYPDRLDLAIERGDCVLAKPGQRLSWHLDLHVGSTADMFAEIERLCRDWQPAFAAAEIGRGLAA
jgi:galactose mutarotase-like enzyme